MIKLCLNCVCALCRVAETSKTDLIMFQTQFSIYLVVVRFMNFSFFFFFSLENVMERICRIVAHVNK